MITDHANPDPVMAPSSASAAEPEYVITSLTL